MSLINQMLKDLDARHESEARGRLHREVRALPAAPQTPLPAIAAGAVLLLVAGGGWLAFTHFADGRAQPAAVVVPPVPVAAPAPLAAAPLPPVAAVPATDAPAAVVADENSGLKLAEALDKPPAELPSKRPPPRPQADPASPAAATRMPAPASTPAPAARETVTAKSAAPAAPAVVDKTPPAKTPAERADTDYRRAVALAGGGRGGEAVDLLLDALRADGGHVASRQLLARLLVEQRRHNEAMAILAEGLAAQPGQVAWAMLLARLQADRGDFAAASRTLQGSLPYATGNADYQGFAGFVAHRLGRQKESAEFYQAAVRVAPGEGRWWFGLGLALEADQRSAEAREAFARARASGTLNADLTAIVDQKLR